jgi:hypothetical protein
VPPRIGRHTTSKPMAGEGGSHLVWRLGMRHEEQIRVLAIDDDCISFATFDDQTRRRI